MTRTRESWKAAALALLLATGGAAFWADAANAADATCSTTTGAPPIQTVAIAGSLERLEKLLRPGS